MTAIAGFWTFEAGPADESCARMLKAQQVYGRSTAQSDHGIISLGRNLFPILPEDRFDKGPVQRGPFSLVADLRLDNRAELASDLGIADGTLSRMADCELLFEGLFRWGESAVERLVGEFAFAFWNDSDQSLLLGRDIFGLRPLYLHRSRSFVAFSTMPSGLHALSEVPYAFDADFMVDRFALLPQTGTKTFYLGLERVEPASLVKVTRERTVASRYWNPRRQFCRASAADYEEGLRDVVEKAVKSQLRGAENGVATHLSSGLDSSIVSVTAARLLSPKPVLAFTAVPRAGYSGPVPPRVIGSEAALASETAALYPNVEHIFVESSAESPMKALDSNHAYFQQPTVNLDNDVWARQINRLARRRGLSVLLTGSFGNMSVSYSGMEWLSWLVAHGKLGAAWKLGRSLLERGVPRRVVLNQLAGPFLPAPLWRLATRIYGRPTQLRDYSALNPSLIQKAEAKAASEGFDLLYRPSADPVQFRLTALFRVDLGNYGKGVLAEHGLSVRDPTADRRVVEYCLSVPPEEYVRGGQTRSLARRAFRDRLPESVVQSKLRGYQSADWYEAIEQDLENLREEVESITRCGSAGEVMDMDWLNRTVSGWPTTGWETEAVRLRYRHGLLRAVQAGHFMRKVAGSN